MAAILDGRRVSGAARLSCSIAAVETARLETFSDGVFAIAATLLVLEIGVASPLRHSLGRELLDLWPSYLAYVTSFMTIGIIWVNHHACFERIERADRPLLFLNTVFLMVISFLPFPTKLVAEFLQSKDERAAVVAYCATLLLMALLFNRLWWWASHHRRLIAETVPQERVDEITRSFVPGPFLYAAAVALAFVTPLGAVALTLALAAFYVPSASIWVRRR
jgi:uncharacterized membrane protein